MLSLTIPDFFIPGTAGRHRSSNESIVVLSKIIYFISLITLIFNAVSYPAESNRFAAAYFCAVVRFLEK